MTPGDAKALVQALIDLYPTQPDRLQVFKALNATCRAVVEKLRRPRECQDQGCLTDTDRPLPLPGVVVGLFAHCEPARFDGGAKVAAHEGAS